MQDAKWADADEPANGCRHEEDISAKSDVGKQKFCAGDRFFPGII